MRTFDVQTVEIGAPVERVFDYIADPANLPEWTDAFKTVSGGRASLQMPEGSVEIGLEVRASRPHGTIDWFMTFPDGGVGRASSRVIGTEPGRCIYTFVLTTPPVPLERVEGTLDEQSKILRGELDRLRTILVAGAATRPARR